MASAPLFRTEFWRNGPQPGSIYNFPGGKTEPDFNPMKRTMNPTVTGTSVLGLKFKDGVVISADKLGSYGSLARYRDLTRVMKINDTTILGSSGDYADFQFLTNLIQERVIEEECLNDGFGYTPLRLFSWLTRVLYNRRSNFNPLWNTYIVGGLQDGEPFLGYVDKIGTAYQAATVASGYGAYIAQPLLREAFETNPNMSLEEAAKTIDRCMKILFYRDARSLNKHTIGYAWQQVLMVEEELGKHWEEPLTREKLLASFLTYPHWPNPRLEHTQTEYDLAIVTKDGVEIKSSIVSETNWEISDFVKGYE